MRLSTKGRYGLKTMVDLAMEYGRGPMSVAALAKLQGISESYLEQLVGALRRAGLVVSARGAQGGYSLARGPDEITGGASNDLSRAAEIASAMALDLGMTGEPGVALRPLKNACGAGDALDRCKELLNQQFDAVTSLLRDNSELLMKLTEALTREETIDEHRFLELVA